MFVRTNGTVRQQTGRWHRRQNKARQGMGTDKSDNSISSESQQNGFGSMVASNLPQLWRAGLTSRSWTWSDIATYPTIV